MKTEKIKKVLIALDYDQTALKVAETGYAMAKAMDAEVTLLHVMSDPVYFVSTEYAPLSGITDSMEVDPLQFDDNDRLKIVSQHFLDKIKHHLHDNSIVTVLEEGEFADTIVMKAKGMGADVLVMGSHSYRWLEDLVQGSVAVKVVQNTSVPVYIVPTKQCDRTSPFINEKCGFPNQ
jgi:nucleotide-binding universal stress UspA family protein